MARQSGPSFLLPHLYENAPIYVNPKFDFGFIRDVFIQPQSILLFVIDLPGQNASCLMSQKEDYLQQPLQL